MSPVTSSGGIGLASEDGPATAQRRAPATVEITWKES